MTGLITVVFLALIIFVLASCSASKKITALKPEPTLKKPLVYTTNTSIISMPVEVSLTGVEQQLNKVLDNIIYEDSIITDDNTEMKIWKTGQIKLSDNNGMIHSEIPLRIWTRFKYGTDFLGLNDMRVLNLKGTVWLKSKVEMKNWNMLTTSELVDFKWDESPSVEIVGKKIPVGYIVNPAINLFKKKIGRKIDDAISEFGDYKPYIFETLDSLSKPVLTSDQYETWVKINPIELYSTNATLERSIVKLNLALKCTILTMVGSKPEHKFDASKIKLLPVRNTPESFEASVAAIVSYDDAGRLITKNFSNTDINYKNKKFKVDKAQMWYRDEKVIIALEINGSIKGTIYLSGKPQYETETKTIYFSDLDYALDTKNILLKTADWMAGNLILEKIKTLCRFSIQEKIDEARISLMTFMNDFSPMTNVHVNGQIDSFDFEKMEINNSAIISFIKIRGKVKTTITGSFF
ncbi:MAG: DUF4403 family protein [Deltaproteobacteria bacterium]